MSDPSFDNFQLKVKEPRRQDPCQMLFVKLGFDPCDAPCVPIFIRPAASLTMPTMFPSKCPLHEDRGQPEVGQGGDVPEDLVVAGDPAPPLARSAGAGWSATQTAPGSDPLSDTASSADGPAWQNATGSPPFSHLKNADDPG